MSPDLGALPPRISSKISVEVVPGVAVPGPCWVWTAWRNNKGYGMTSFGRGNIWLVHRYTYTTFVGEIPDGLQIDHLCRTRPCCNPAHLEAVTGKVNHERGVKAQATHCARGHEFSGHNLIRKKSNGTRECRACKYESQERSLRRRRAAGLPVDHSLHGTITGYQNYACRCDECRSAGAVAWQRNKSRTRRIEALAAQRADA